MIKKTLNVKEKIELINDYKSGLRQTDLTIKYGISAAAVSRILSNEDQILKAVNANQKRARKSDHPHVEEELLRWFHEKRGNTVLTGKMVLEKARELAVQLNDDFDPNRSWIQRWCKRNSICVARATRGKAKLYRPKSPFLEQHNPPSDSSGEGSLVIDEGSDVDSENDISMACELDVESHYNRCKDSSESLGSETEDETESMVRKKEDSSTVSSPNSTVTNTSTKKVLTSIAVVQAYCHANDIDSTLSLQEIKEIVVKNSQQRKITDYFKKIN